jgi:hypothetical protein
MSSIGSPSIGPDQPEKSVSSSHLYVVRPNHLTIGGAKLVQSPATLDTVRTASVALSSDTDNKQRRAEFVRHLVGKY